MTRRTNLLSIQNPTLLGITILRNLNRLNTLHRNMMRLRILTMINRLTNINVLLNMIILRLGTSSLLIIHGLNMHNLTLVSRHRAVFNISNFNTATNRRLRRRRSRSRRRNAP